MKPKASIIIPVYNGEATIKRCIDSVVNQSLRELEIIIVDDGSTDGTSKIISACARDDERIRVIAQENAGQGLARNAGVDAATGEFIGFVDSDDTIAPEMYEKMLERAESSRADVVQCNLENVFQNDTRVIQLPIFDRIVNVTDRANYFANYLFRNLHSYECCNKLIKREFLISSGIRFHSNSEVHSEDLFFNLDIALKLNTIAFMGDTYYYYYQYSNSHSKNKTEEKISLLLEQFKIFEKKVNDRELLLETGKLATLIVLLNLSHILDTDAGVAFARRLLKDKDLKRYIRYSFIRMKRTHHKLIMLYLIIMPIGARIKMIKLYYENMK